MIINYLALALLTYIIVAIVISFVLDYLMGIKDSVHKQLLTIAWPVLAIVFIVYVILFIIAGVVSIVINSLIKVFSKAH